MLGLIFSTLFVLFAFSQKLPVFFNPALFFGGLGILAGKLAMFDGLQNAYEWVSIFKQPWLWAVILFLYARTFSLQAIPHLRKNILKSFAFYAVLGILIVPSALAAVQFLVTKYVPAKFLIWPLLSNKELIFLGFLSLPVAHSLYLRTQGKVLGPVATQLKALTLISEIIFLLGFVAYLSFQNLNWVQLGMQLAEMVGLLVVLWLLWRYGFSSKAGWVYELGLLVFILAMAEILGLPLPMLAILSALLLAQSSKTSFEYPEALLFLEAFLFFLGSLKLVWSWAYLPGLIGILLLVIILRWVLMWLSFKLAGTSRTLQIHGSLGWLYFSTVSFLPLLWLQGVTGFNLSVHAQFLVLAVTATQVLSWVFLKLNFKAAGENP